MKPTMSLILLAAVIFVSCSKKISPAQQSPVSTTVTQPPPAETVTTRAIDVKADQGKIVFTEKCGKCHALKNPADFTADQWDSILKRMAPNARLTPDETEQVAAYVRSLAKK